MSSSGRRNDGPRNAGRAISGLAEAAAGVAFALLLVAGCVVLGLVIAWPLWAFATGARQAYTITVLAAAAAGVAFLAVRSARRRRAALKDPTVPRRSTVSVLLTALMAVVGIGGAWLTAALLVRRLWTFGVAGAAAGGVLLWLLARARRAARRRAAARKEDAVPAENWSE